MRVNCCSVEGRELSELMFTHLPILAREAQHTLYSIATEDLQKICGCEITQPASIPQNGDVLAKQAQNAASNEHAARQVLMSLQIASP